MGQTKLVFETEEINWLRGDAGNGWLIDLTVMDRDRRLTGYLRGQTDRVEAPEGFELNNPWRVSALRDVYEI